MCAALLLLVKSNISGAYDTIAHTATASKIPTISVYVCHHSHKFNDIEKENVCLGGMKIEKENQQNKKKRSKKLH